MILGFRREVNEKCALLDYYAASGFFDVSGQPIGPVFKGKNPRRYDQFFRNVGKRLRLLAA